MEKVGEFFKNIMDRFSNPLIFSFIVSWMVINWQITVGLLWYDDKLLQNTGCNTIFEFIKDHLNKQDSFWNPLGIALIYTFILPIVKNVIQAFNTWIITWGDTWNLRISKGGKVGVDKFLQLREDHKKRTTILEKVISEEGDYLNKYNAAKTSELEAQERLNQTIRQINEKDIIIDGFTNINLLAGNWVNSYEPKNGIPSEEDIHISGEAYYVISKYGDRKHTFDIRNFFYDKGRNSVFFIKELTFDEKQKRPVTEHFSINRLRFDGNDILSGFENGTTKISYKRK
jgi:hypothetical protein